MQLAWKCFQFGVQEWKESIRKRALFPIELNNGKEKMEKKKKEKVDKINFEVNVIRLFFTVIVMSID